MFFGKIPFPADIVFAFPPFMAVIPDGPPAPHADIGDLVHFFYPFRALAASNARKGELPLWNPYILSGTPFLADAQSALFYPLNFFYYILPVPLAWAMSFPLRTLLAGLFTVLFVRKIGGSKTGATISAILFSFCGFLIIWQGQAMSDAAIWLPLICYSVVRLHSELSARSLVLTSLAFALPVLAGHPETAAHLTLTGVGLAGLLAVARPDAHAPRVNLPFIKFFTAAGMQQSLCSGETRQKFLRGLRRPEPAQLRFQKIFRLIIHTHLIYLTRLRYGGSHQRFAQLFQSIAIA